jgi:hypothetical protein
VATDHKAAQTSSAFTAGPSAAVGSKAGTETDEDTVQAVVLPKNPYISSSEGGDIDNDGGNNSMEEVQDKKGIRRHYCHTRGHSRKECCKLKNGRAACSGDNGNDWGGGGYRGSGTGNASQPRHSRLRLAAQSQMTGYWTQLHAGT